MTDLVVEQARPFWNFEDAEICLAAARENLVFQAVLPSGRFAMRLHRPGYRTDAELASELGWMAALAEAGASMPQPVATNDGRYWIKVGDTVVDVLTWLDARPMASDGKLNVEGDLVASVTDLGRALARIHVYSDSWVPSADFSRPAWNQESLLGEAPLWGRFWDASILADDEKALLAKARDAAIDKLSAISSGLDYGLIHADAVLENVLVRDDKVSIIDFDDGGYGYRLFDLATTAHSLDQHDPDGDLTRAFLRGYTSERHIDLSNLPVFRLIRSLSYVGWVSERLDASGHHSLREKYVAKGVEDAAEYLGSMR